MTIYNVVTNAFVMSEIRKCKYFKKNLGLVSTVDKGVSREFNDKDKFAFNYQKTFKTSIFGQGNVGNMKFYIDHYIKESVLVVYFGENFEEFIFEVDFLKIKEKGIDSFLGHILKETDQAYEQRAKDNLLKKEAPKQSGNAEKITKNPGAVTYEDVKLYLEQQNKDRFKKNNS